jgi:hypothetical protein
MDRLSRTLVCGLALALVAQGTGCRSTRSEVPAGRTFNGEGKSDVPPVGFSTTPNPVGGYSALPPGGTASPGAGQLGTPASTAGNFGLPGNSFGPPGTSNPGAPAGAANPTTGIPQNGTGPGGAGLQPPTQQPF